MMEPDNGLLLIGGGGHCRSLIDVLEAAQISVAGVVHGADCSQEPVLGYQSLGTDENLPELRKTYSRAIVSVGQSKDAAVRKRLFSMLDELDFTLPAVSSPIARVSAHSRFGFGTVIMHHALINANARIGKNCIINTKALVEHDCIIGDHCHLAVGACLCGGVEIGDSTFIGAGAVIRPGVRIGRDCFIRMGAVVTKNMPDGGRA